MRRPPQRRQAGGAVGVAAEEDRAAPPAHQPGAAQRQSDGLATDAEAVVLAEYQRDRLAGPAAAALWRVVNGNGWRVKSPVLRLP